METTRLQPDIYLAGVRICEPVIALTGLLMWALCSYAWIRLQRRSSRSLPFQLLTWFFLLMGLSSLVGAVFSHAFHYWAGLWGKGVTWGLILLSQVALGQAVIEHARSLLPGHVARVLTVVNILALPAALAFTLMNRTILVVEIHTAFVMFGLVGSLETFIYKRRRDPASKLLLWSIPVAVIAVIPHLLKWSPGIWFSYFDVGHLIVCVSLWFILLGAERLTPA